MCRLSYNKFSDLMLFKDMAEQHGKDYIPLIKAPKSERYKQVRTELEDRLDSGCHPLANTSNLIAILKQEFNWWWIGFYWLKKQEGNEHLVLGQFQGPPACTRLFKGVGVCGTSWQQKKSIVLEDVNTFEGHIACSSASRSEIVIPIILGEEVIGVLDIDSANYSQFDWEDEKELRSLLEVIGELGQFEWFAKNI